MRLKYVDRISIIGAVLVGLCLILAYSEINAELTLISLWIAVVLALALVIFNVIFNRCPKCGTYLWRTGDFCTSCGEHLQKYR